ncbi:DUF1257 domain-containing protein [Maioricimonas sp. JC845]|uniref:DUF1257 domain-containing protein n=1 Tax=Maioricimonas sp. JC845 TaxID=3232138 RepID=UPI0034599F91
MSHIVTIETEVRDVTAIRQACDRLTLPPPIYGQTRLFSSGATGWQVKLPDWQYPVVCDVNTGRLAYDNFGGRWGAPEQLDRFLQAYAVEKATLEARKQGYSVFERSLDDGSIHLRIQTGADT